MRNRSVRARVRIALAALALCLLASAPGQAIEPVDPIIDAPMLQDPFLPPQEQERLFPPRLLPMWLEALQRPDVETRRQVADAMGEAFEQGMPDLKTRATTPLMGQLRDSHPTMRLAAARALIRMDAREAADELLTLNEQGDQDMILQTDPALAAWDHQPARVLWLKRAKDAETGFATRASAIRSLHTVKSDDAVPALKTIAMDPLADAGLRLTAARALGGIVRSGLVADAEKLVQGKAGIEGRLVAMAMLQGHSDDRAVKAQVEQVRRGLAPRGSSAVAASAMENLLQAKPVALEPLLGDAVASGDSRVRMLAAQTMVSLATPATVAQLGRMLDDVHPRIRTYARAEMIGFGSQERLRPAVLEAATAALATSGWRSQEQAAFVLGKLNHEPAADRLLQVLRETPRHEARLAAAAALRWLAIPQTLSSVFDHAQAVATGKSLANAELVQKGRELAQMLQMLGGMEYAQGDALFRRFIPKNSGFSSEARSAAIWALGRIHAGKADAALASQFAGRLSDIAPLEPESNDVRQQSAIAIGRMKARNAMGALQKFGNLEMEGPDIVSACQWALAHIAGREMEPLPVAQSQATGWFLEPVDSSSGR